MRKIFWQDPYLTRLSTEIARVDGDRVWLDATIFFAFSGGQESDSGTIGGHLVQAAEKDGLDIAYRLTTDHDLRAGQPVEIEIDWPRRYQLMRLHFAAEMILQLIYQQQPGITRIGAHIAADKARIDFATDVSLASMLELLRSQAQALIDRDIPIITGFSDVENQRRFWSVDGFAQMACGGTHPRSTGEVGTITLKRRNPGKGKERVEISLG